MPKEVLAKEKKKDRIVIILFIFLIIMTLFLNYFSSYYISIYTEIIQENIEQRLFTECRVLQNIVPIEMLNEFVVPEDMNKPEYQELVYELEVYADENDLMFAFFIRLVDGQVQYIIDSDSDPDTHYGLDHFEEPYQLAVEAFNGKPAYNKIGEYLDGWEGILSAYVPIFDENDDVIAVVGVDISDEEIVQRRNASRVLTTTSVICTVFLVIINFSLMMLYRKKAKEYDAASKAKSEFLSRMSHEIRTPMNAIIGYCRIAKKTDDVVKQGEYLDNISKSSDYLLQLINNILDISKIEAGNMNLNLEKVSIYEIVKNIHIMMASQVRIKNQKFNITVSNDIPGYVYCDNTRLTQVIVNLISNALKFTPEEGEIGVDVSLLEINEDKCNLQFIVSDTGIGIEEKYIEKLFEPFEQGDGGITRKYGGTGLRTCYLKTLCRNDAWKYCCYK